MSTYVIIPGGYHGGWWFQPVVRQLRRQGHEAIVVTLTGVGERSHLVTAATNLETHIHDVLNVVEYEDLHDVVVCAHSYGGMVASGVADRAFGRIASLVFLDAQVPRDGEALWDLTTESERKRFLASTRDGVLTDPPPGLDSRATAHPLASFLQPLRLSSSNDRIPRKVYVYMSGWPDSPLAAMYDRVKDDPAWQAEVWTCGHDIIAEAGQETTELLLTEAPEGKESRKGRPTETT